MIRILLADDHDVVRRGVRNLLETTEGWRVCGEARDGSEAVALAGELRPDVAILDLMMPGMDGLEATRRIRKTLPDTEVLIFTMHDTEQLVREVLAAGARGYVLKSDIDRYLIAAVEALAGHNPFFTSKVAETMLNACLKSDREGAPADPLTERERQVVCLIADCQSSKEIAAALGISVKTVETHRSAIMRKLNVNTAVELVRYAIRHHLVEP